MVLEVLVDIKRIEELRVEACKEHVYNNRYVDLLLPSSREVAVRELLILDTLLNILVIKVEVVDVVVCTVTLVVVGDDRFERDLLTLWIVSVIFLFLRQILLNLLDVLVSVGRRREYRSDLKGDELRIDDLAFALKPRKDREILYGVIDRCCCEQSIEASLRGRSVVIVEYRLSYRLFGKSLAWLKDSRIRSLVVVDMEAEDVPILDRMRDSVCVQLLVKEILRSLQGGDVSLNLFDRRVFFKDRCASEAEKLGVWEKVLNVPVVITKLRPMALVEDEDHPFVT